MDDHTKQVCTFYERNIIGNVDDYENTFNPEFDFSGDQSARSRANMRQYKLFRAYVSSRQINGNDT